jgi:hypothetical protein
MKLSFLELVQTGQIAHAASGATRLRDHTKAQFRPCLREAQGFVLRRGPSAGGGDKAKRTTPLSHREPVRADLDDGMRSTISNGRSCCALYHRRLFM